ncbi:hypothetical protein ES332_A06G138600v1 [Gossypium tomentosum]|uniref:Uncharacterized protein n=1 Tax=Gossypium tomentosum TaxID=34277 RepID=A0A5D2Q4K4_GOSTO|nr:hypothetical protein ES332_A06G138600v1 [Gossypium tomentosum]
MREDMEMVAKPEVVKVVTISLESTLSPLPYIKSINVVTTGTKKNKSNLIRNPKYLKISYETYRIQIDDVKSYII